MKLIALSGSLRKASFNTRLANAIAKRAPDGVLVEVATCHGIPLYDGDLEESAGVPAAVTELRGRIRAADGLILVTPEYNAGMPGVLKNTLDWLSRPPSEMYPNFEGRPTALAGATPGGLGTTLAQSGALVVLRQFRVRLFPDHLRVSSAKDVFDESDDVTGRTAETLDTWLAKFVDFAGAD